MEITAVQLNGGIWDRIAELTKIAQDEGGDPLSWAIQISSNLASAGISLPSLELANLLVSYVFGENSVPIAWKFLEKALDLKIVPPFLVLGLISTRAVPFRRSHPASFRLYMELLKRHAFSLKENTNLPNHLKTMNSLDKILNLSQIFDVQANEAGIILVLFVFSLVWQLVDAALDDENLLNLTSDNDSRWPVKPQNIDVDVPILSRNDEMRQEHKQRLKTVNSIMTIELIAQFLQHKVTSRILFLARQNRSKHWENFIKRMQLVFEHSSALRNSKSDILEVIPKLISSSLKIMSQHFPENSSMEFHPVVQSSPLAASAGCSLGCSPSGLWLPLDLFLEDAMDGSEVNATSAVEIITGLVKSQQAINATSWHETFLGLWMAALRLVQRERDPIEGPIPRIDTRLCMLLSITTLVVADLVEEEEKFVPDDINFSLDRRQNIPGRRRLDLMFSLQILPAYQSLLTPPQSVIVEANQAAMKAMAFVSGINVGSAFLEGITATEMPTNSSGSLYHLIIEACIARNLLDTSAYFWPGYVNGRINQPPHGIPTQVPGWSSFMKGALLTPVMINALVSTPASSFAEIDKVFRIAVNGSNDERIAAAAILCGASLSHGWNIQEHTAYFINRLLSPSAPLDYSGSDSYLISYAPMLNALLVGIAPVDCIQIFSLHGLVPELAGSLMTICEVFGSCIPNISLTVMVGEQISAHAVFSNAFSLLLRLWRFNHPPIEYGIGDVPPVGSQLTPEYLLLVRNSYLMSSEISLQDPNRKRLAQVAISTSPKPIFVDSFPKLKAWYRQHLACIVSPLTGLVSGTTVHHTVDTLLNMMFKRFSSSNQSARNVASGSDNYDLRPTIPAWDILEAVPFVADAALTACAHERLNPRALCTGLKDLVDYLPATLATIVSYFSAEVTRGVWKSVFMNGTDWPSPAANFSNVEEQIKKILATTGVDVPSLAGDGGTTPASLPLPLAAFLSLTITYKLDKTSQRFLDLAGPALEHLAAGCPWPCMPIVASLWTQKAKRWSDFLIFSASRTVFLHSNDAVVQLLRSCFNATLGLNTICVSNNDGIGALLGHGFKPHFSGGISPVAPGILYLRVYRSIRGIMSLTDDIVSLLMQTVGDISNAKLPGEASRMPKKTNGTKFVHSSLVAIMTRVKLAAALGASIIFLTGGLGLVQSLFKETFPSWFMSIQRIEGSLDGSGTLSMLRGYALAYLAVLCGAFAWGVNSSSSTSPRQRNIIGNHMEFLASVLDGKISLGCDSATWHAYVSGFLSLMVKCAPTWILELDVELLIRLSKGLRKSNEVELSLAILRVSSAGTIRSAIELILETEL